MGYSVTMVKQTKKTPQKKATTQVAKKQKATKPREIGNFIVRNKALLMTVIAKTMNTTYPFGATSVNLSQAGLAKASLGWLANLMSLYDLFKFEDIELEWVPSASAFTSGSLAMYYDPTPNAQPPASYAAVSGNAGVVNTQISKPIRHRISPTTLRGRIPWYLVESNDPTTSCQGCVIVCQSPGSIPSASGDVMLGSLWITYSIHLKNPTYLSAARDQQVNPPVLDQLIYEETQNISNKLDRQIYAQEDTAESCQIMSQRPGVPPSLSSDLNELTTAVQRITSLVQKIDVNAINSANGVVTNLNKLPEMLVGAKGALNDTSQTGFYRIRARTNLPTRDGGSKDDMFV